MGTDGAAASRASNPWRDLTRDGRLLFATRFIRLLAYGSLSVVLVFYLVAVGLSEAQIGFLITLTLLRDGHEVARLACPASQLGGTFRIRTDGTWTPGDYELRLLPEGGAPLSRWNLRVR